MKFKININNVFLAFYIREMYFHGWSKEQISACLYHYQTIQPPDWRGGGGGDDRK